MSRKYQTSPWLCCSLILPSASGLLLDPRPCPPTALLPQRHGCRAGAARCALGPQVPQLAAVDVTIIFSYSFARALGLVLLSPEFEGWLAPISVEPVRFMNTIAFASWCTFLWLLGAGFSGGFAAVATESPRAAALTALRSWSAGALLYILGTFLLALGFETCAGWFCADAALSGQRELLPPPDIGTLQGSIGLGLALLVWRVTFAEFRDPWR